MAQYVRNRYFGENLQVRCFYGTAGEHAIYEDLLAPLARRLKRNIRERYQNVIVVEGPTGSGKSTLAIQLARAMDPAWKISDNYVYTSEDLARKLNDPAASPISLIDEGSVVLNSANAMRGEDKSLVVLFDTMRSLGWTTIICIPRFDNLNKRVRETHVTYRIMIPDSAPIRGYDNRGFAMIYYPIVTSRWSGGVYWKLIGTTLVRDLPPRIRGEYEPIKKRHQLDYLKKLMVEDDAE